MDPQTDLPDLVEDLEVNIDELTDTLGPLLNTALTTTASTLPLLDKAKLYVLAAYSIESLLYSSLQASGANAKDHAVFRELARLKGYFGKIKEIEDRGAQPQQSKQKLDVGAAARFIKHGLAGNDKYDLERAERVAKEKARAHLKAALINKKFDDEGRQVSAGVTPKERGVEEVTTQDDVNDSDSDILQGLEDSEAAHTSTQASKKTKLYIDDEPVDMDAPDSKKKPKKRARKAKASPAPDASAESPTEPPTKKRKQRSKKGKKSAEKADAAAGEVEEDTVTPGNAKRAKARPKKAK